MLTTEIRRKLELMKMVHDYCERYDKFVLLFDLLALVEMNPCEFYELVAEGQIPEFEHRFAVQFYDSYVLFPISDNDPLTVLINNSNKNIGERYGLKGKEALTIEAACAVPEKLDLLLGDKCVIPHRKILERSKLFEVLDVYEPQLLIQYKISEDIFRLKIFIDDICITGKSTININKSSLKGRIVKLLFYGKGSFSMNEFLLSEKKRHLIGMQEKENDEEWERYSKSKGVARDDFDDEIMKKQKSTLGNAIKELNKLFAPYENKLKAATTHFLSYWHIEDDEYFEMIHEAITRSKKASGRKKRLFPVISENSKKDKDRPIVEFKYNFTFEDHTNNLNF